MKARIPMLCAAVFAASALVTSLVHGSATFALWSDVASPTALSVQAVHATVSMKAVAAPSQSATYLTPSTSSSDPQYFTTAASSSGTGLTYGPNTNCSLPNTYGSSSMTYKMCGAYHLNYTATQQALVALMTANPPAAGATTMPTYSVATAIEIDAEVWGYMEVDAVFNVGSASQSGTMLGDSKIHMGFVSSLSACTGTATSNYETGTTVLVPAGNGDKTATTYVCLIQSYTPTSYQNTATGTNGNYTHSDTWSAPLYDSSAGSGNFAITVGINPLT